MLQRPLLTAMTQKRSDRCAGNDRWSLQRVNYHRKTMQNAEGRGELVQGGVGDELVAASVCSLVSDQVQPVGVEREVLLDSGVLVECVALDPRREEESEMKW